MKIKVLGPFVLRCSPPREDDGKSFLFRRRCRFKPRSQESRDTVLPCTAASVCSRKSPCSCWISARGAASCSRPWAGRWWHPPSMGPRTRGGVSSTFCKHRSSSGSAPLDNTVAVRKRVIPIRFNLESDVFYHRRFHEQMLFSVKETFSADCWEWSLEETLWSPRQDYSDCTGFIPIAETLNLSHKVVVFYSA